MHFELCPLIVWIALWIVNAYSAFQVNIFCNNRDITKCQSLTLDNDDARQCLGFSKAKQEGHDGPEIAHLSLLTKHAPSSFPVT